MTSRARSFFGRLSAVATVLGISMLGNLRLQASEETSTTMRSSMAAGSAQHVLGTVRVVHTNADSAFGDDVDGGASTDDVPSSANDDGQLVPAIYAWDPDVRFVYYRHVSKWM